jgi:hypothetical protein
VPGAVHVQAGADSVADKPGLQHAVPPAVDSVGSARLLRVGPVDVRRALLG